MLVHNIFHGLFAGLLATLVLSLLMLTKNFLPQLETITMLDGVLRVFLEASGEQSLPAPLGGWLWHFVIGTLWWGALYGVIEPILPGNQPWKKGISFGIGGAIFVMLMVMPLAGAGYFGMHLELIQPIVTFVEHLIYGCVLGFVYDRTSRSLNYRF